MISDSPEARLVACVMRDHGQIERVNELVTPEDFENPHLSALYAGVLSLVTQHVETNALIISGYLPDWGIHPSAIDLNDLVRIEHDLVYNAWEATEYARMVRSAAVARGLETTARFMLDNRDDGAPFDIAGRAQQMLGQILSGQTAGRLRPRPLGDILADSWEHDWLVDGLFERQDRLVLTGHEGHGKSWFMRQLAVCMAAGMHPFKATVDIDPVKVLAIDAENTERQWARGTQYMVGRTEAWGQRSPREHVLVQAGMRLDLTKPGEVNEIHRLCDRHEPDVLYIGPLYKLVPGEITNDDDAGPLIATLDGFRERGLTLLMEAHAGHGKGIGGERDMRPRGSSALLGWPEFGMGIRPMEDDPAMATLVTWRGARETRDWPKHIRRGVEGEMPWMPVWEW